MITAAVDILGGVGADYVQSGKCANGPPAAFLKMHGVKDPFITYNKQVCVTLCVTVCDCVCDCL